MHYVQKSELDSNGSQLDSLTERKKEDEGQRERRENKSTFVLYHTYKYF